MRYQTSNHALVHFASHVHRHPRARSGDRELNYRVLFSTLCTGCCCLPVCFSVLQDEQWKCIVFYSPPKRLVLSFTAQQCMTLA